MAASSQVRSIERRKGVSTAEVVMDVMAIGYPVSLGPVSAFWASFPGIHIAQFHRQVIGNCGVILVPQRNGQEPLALNHGSSDAQVSELPRELPVGGGRNMTVSWRRGLQGPRRGQSAA